MNLRRGWGLLQRWAEGLRLGRAGFWVGFARSGSAAVAVVVAVLGWRMAGFWLAFSSKLFSETSMPLIEINGFSKQAEKAHWHHFFWICAK